MENSQLTWGGLTLTLTPNLCPSIKYSLSCPPTPMALQMSAPSPSLSLGLFMLS